ncbi:DUF2267 domain-containing protein [Streptomyces sp. NPDC048270]|uniref:DUF2267 domain-containing protein n=1 Tax=Streptomyces sp. NPDC048270 TaxID=3154615 RepID=UPI0033E7D0C2
MYDQPRPNRATPAMTFDQMLERVRYEGAYPTRERAEEAVRTVLAALGRRLTGDERVDLAQCLPVEAALTLTSQIPDTEHLTGWGFVKDLAERTGATPATARWDTGAVFAAVTHLAGPDLLARILHQLPGGYALLFGQAELRQPQLRAAAA